MTETDSEDLPEQQLNAPASESFAEVETVRAALHARLLAASLRTEAVRAGMIDLDGLKLVDLSSITLDERDHIVDGSEIMRTLRKNKPWLFRTVSSSSSAAAPASRPPRQKHAMEMSDDEYLAARQALIKR